MKENMPQRPEQTIKKEEITPAKASEAFKSSLVGALNRHLPEQAFDLSKNISMQLEAGGIKLKQTVEMAEITEGKTFFTGVKERVYVFDPEDAARYFKKLSPEVQKSYVSGLEKTTNAGEKIIKDYEAVLAAEDATEIEKKEAQARIREERDEIEIKKRLVEKIS